MQVLLESQILDLLDSLNQTHITKAFNASSNQTKKDALLQQLNKLNMNYPGGLKGYSDCAKSLCKDLKEGVNPWDGWNLEVPAGGTTLSLKTNEKLCLEYEEIGKSHMGKVCFMVMAGGLGERLGYDGVKPEITVDLMSNTSFLQLYIEYALSYQRDFAEPGQKIPFAIFVSDDTEALMRAHMKANNNFGLAEDQFFVVKQEKVAAFCDNECTFSFNEEEFLIDSKPHGHGDVHLYLNQSGLIKKWLGEGREYVFIFNDTNPLVFRMLPSAIGNSVKNNLAMNTIGVPRIPGEAMGGLCTIHNEKSGKKITTNIEYNIMANLAKTFPGGKEPTDEHGFSKFPGNTNAIIFHLPSYNEILEKSGGTVPEFCNPKYANAEKTVFKTPTRVESMISELPRIMDGEVHKVGFTEIDRMMSFSACKNDLVSGKAKFDSQLPPETMSTCEHEWYAHNRILLEMAGIKLPVTSAGILVDVYNHSGMEFEQLPKVVLMPSFSTTLQGIKDAFKGENSLSCKSTLVLRDRLVLENFNLDGNMEIVGHGTGEPKVVKDLTFKGQNYTEFVDSDASDADYLKIRGYKVKVDNKLVLK